MGKAKEISIDLLDKILSKRTEEEKELIRYKMLLAAKIDRARKAKGWKRKHLAEALGKKPETITRWLSGTNNFTTDTLWKIGKVLGIDLINYIDAKSEVQISVYKLIISDQKLIEKKPDYDWKNFDFYENIFGNPIKFDC